MATIVTRRSALRAVIPLMTGGIISQQARATSPVQAVTPEMFGAFGRGDDDQAGLERALAFCKQNSKPLFLGPKRYLHSQDLVIDGVQVVASSQRSQIIATSDKGSALILTGSGARLERITKSSLNPHVRTSGLDGIKVLRATDFVIEDCIIRNTAATGIFISQSTRGLVKDSMVQNTLADGVHITGCTSKVTIVGVKTLSTGDDGIAVVSYHKDRGVCHDISVIDCVSIDSNARGMAVVGGTNIRFRSPIIKDSKCAGIYLFGEDAYDTYGVSRCKIEGGLVSGCVTNDVVGHACVMMGGRSGSDVENGTTLPRGANHCVVIGLEVLNPAYGSYGGIACRENSSQCEIKHCEISRFSAMHAPGYRPISDKGNMNVFSLNQLI